MAITADVLIVGAGAAGCVLANRLTADPSRRVILVEAGRRVTDPDVARPERWPFIQGRDFDWAYTTLPQAGLAGRTMPWPRGLGLGGSSNLHAMAHMRGDVSDFSRWAERTRDDRWSWERLLPFFRASERFTARRGDAEPDVHGSDGPLPVVVPDTDLVSPVVVAYLEAWEGLGARAIPDHNHGSMIGATPNALTIANGRRVTDADAYLFPALRRPGLTVLDDTIAHTLTLHGDTVRGAEVSRRAVGSQRLTIEADTTIVAAGSLGTPLLLMRSGIGDPESLGAAGVPARHPLPDVGRNLHDHLLGAGNLYRSPRVVPPSRLQLSESMTYLPAAGPAGPGAPELVVGCVVGPSVSEQYAHIITRENSDHLYTLLFGVTHPTSRGSIRMTGPGVDDEPAIDPAYLSTEHDRELFRQAFEMARLVGSQPPFTSWRGEEVLPGASVTGREAIDEFIARAAITHHHPVGTCAMGADETSVVDASLRVRGLRGIHIVDASVFPTITTGPVHAAVLAMAESFAHDVIADS